MIVKNMNMYTEVYNLYTHTLLTKISIRKAMDCTVFPRPISSARIQFCLAYQLNSSQLRPSLW